MVPSTSFRYRDRSRYKHFHSILHSDDSVWARDISCDSRQGSVETIEQSTGKIRSRHRFIQMSIGLLQDNPTPRSPLYKSLHNEIWFVNFFDGTCFLANCCTN